MHRDVRLLKRLFQSIMFVYFVLFSQTNNTNSLRVHINFIYKELLLKYIETQKKKLTYSSFRFISRRLYSSQLFNIICYVIITISFSHFRKRSPTPSHFSMLSISLYILQVLFKKQANTLLVQIINIKSNYREIKLYLNIKFITSRIYIGFCYRI